MLRFALVGAAGALGALARYWIGTAIGVRSFPCATLAINVLGSFLLGFVLGGPGAGRWSPTTTTAVSVGFLGAFTTFSPLPSRRRPCSATTAPAQPLMWFSWRP